MAELMDKYLSMQRNRGKAASTLANERSTIRKLAAHWDGQRRAPSRLDAEALEDFVYGPGGLSERTPNADTFNRELVHIRRFVKWLIDRREVQPGTHEVLAPRPRTPKQFVRITLLQIQHMIDTCDDPYERWIIALASQTLGRESELLRLRFAHFHEDTMTIDWYRPKTRDRDSMFMTDALASELRRWKLTLQESVGRPATGEWFAVPRRWKLGEGAGYAYRQNENVAVYSPDQPRKAKLAPIVQRHVTRITGIPAAELKGQGVHIIRRSGARALYDRLVEERHPDPLRVVMAVLGHANPQVTERYLGIKADRERRNALLAGSRLLSVDTSSVTRLESKRSG